MVMRYYLRVNEALDLLREHKAELGTTPMRSKGRVIVMLDSNGYAISAATKHVFDVDALVADHFELAAEIDGAERREMMHILDHGIGAFTLDASHLLAQSDADAKVALINFANCFGVVKGRGDGQSPVWRVQVREKAPALQSYSEMPGIAPFHTDASYYPFQ